MDKSENRLAATIANLTCDKVRVDTAIPGLSLHRWTKPTEATSYMMAPSICVVGQGQKRLYLGEEAFDFDRRNFLISSVDLPVISRIVDASEETPYLGLTMELNLRIISELMLDNPGDVARDTSHRKTIAVSQLSPAMLDAFNRLLGLIDAPEDISALAPLIQREICYRLLTSDQGPRLRAIVTTGTHNHQVARVIDSLKKNFDMPVKIEELAKTAGLSVSAFHSHFRSMTSMPPLQFLKRIRLTEARRLMLSEQLDASKAAYLVGYESPSQFSREYSRLFGAPPSRDVKQLSEIADLH